MAFPMLSLKWPRCPDGVLITPTVGKSGQKHFMYKSERRADRLHETADLGGTKAMEYFNSIGEKGLENFFGEYGFLNEGWKTVSVDEAVEHQALFRLVVTHALDEDANVSSRALGSLVDNVQLEGFTYIGRGNRPGLALRSIDLLGFIKMELFSASSAGARLAFCQRCGKGVLTGPNTGSKSHMKYCTDACRVAASRSRLKAIEVR
jgi:hypothetical protein